MSYQLIASRHEAQTLQRSCRVRGAGRHSPHPRRSFHTVSDEVIDRIPAAPRRSHPAGACCTCRAGCSSPCCRCCCCVDLVRPGRHQPGGVHLPGGCPAGAHPQPVVHGLERVHVPRYLGVFLVYVAFVAAVVLDRRHPVAAAGAPVAHAGRRAAGHGGQAGTTMPACSAWPTAPTSPSTCAPRSPRRSTPWRRASRSSPATS